jgi:hypothetical protein
VSRPAGANRSGGVVSVTRTGEEKGTTVGQSRGATSTAMGAIRLALCCAAATVIGAAVVPAASAAEPCPNEAIRAGQISEALPGGTTSLPDCMALEMVSPQKKFNQYAKGPVLAASGDRARFVSVAALAETPKQGTILDPYIATRTASGWVTKATSTQPQYTSGYKAAGDPCAYSTDLSHWATWASTESQAKLAITTAFGGGLDGSFAPLSPTLTPINSGTDPFALNNGSCQGASSDASRFFFTIREAAYLANDPVPTVSGGFAVDQNNVYEVRRDESGVPSVALLARDKDDAVYGGRCGVRIGGEGLRGSVSPDASRVYFSTRPSQPEGVECNRSGNKLRILERTQTSAGPVISQFISSECTRIAPACSSSDGDDVYQGASQEGGRVLFTTTRQLADSDRDSTKDLYLYDSTRLAGERLTQLSAGDATDASPGEGAEVLGVPDFAGDGSHAYFVAKDVLTTTANEAGKTAQAGQPNLYLYEYPGGDTAFIGTLSEGDNALGKTGTTGLWRSGPGENTATATPLLGPNSEDGSVGGDGHVLVFESKASLSTDDSDAGKPDVYRYDSETGSLQRVTTAAPGGADNGPFASLGSFPVPTAGEAGTQTLAFGRGVSEDGTTVVFETKEALDPTDTNGASNAYVWREGQVEAIPFGTQPTISMAGDEIAFTSDEQLLAEDGDAAKDVYLLRADGGFVPPVPRLPCEGEACQGPPTPQPASRGAPSEAPSVGNPPIPKPCKKGQVKRHGKCVKKPARHKSRYGKHDSKRASHKQGGRK